MARKKSDHVDAMTLANILRTDIHMHRPLPADTELARAIAVLARAHQDATWRRTRAGNELRSLLREFYRGSRPPSPPAAPPTWSPPMLCRVGDRADPAAPAELTRPASRPRCGEAGAARPRQARRAAAPRSSSPAAASRPDGGRGDGRAGAAAAGHPEHRVRQRRPARNTPSLWCSQPTPITRSSPASPGWRTATGARVLAEIGDDPHLLRRRPIIEGLRRVGTDHQSVSAFFFFFFF